MLIVFFTSPSLQVDNLYYSWSFCAVTEKKISAAEVEIVSDGTSDRESIVQEEILQIVFELMEYYSRYVYCVFVQGLEADENNEQAHTYFPDGRAQKMVLDLESLMLTL